MFESLPVLFIEAGAEAGGKKTRARTGDKTDWLRNTAGSPHILVASATVPALSKYTKNSWYQYRYSLKFKTWQTLLVNQEEEPEGRLRFRYVAIFL